jgi:glutamyl-tRNA reductase
MTLFAAGLSYLTAPVELREQLAVSPSHLIRRACKLKSAGELDEIVLLSTCSRVEIYGTRPQVPAHVDSLFQLLCEEPCEFQNHVYVHEGLEALHHLFCVAAGLDSMVLGESEITGQVKHAYGAAQAEGLTGSILNRVFQKAFQTVKEIRTRTGVGRGAASVGSVAVELAQRIFRHDLSKQSVMIIGAGKMGEACMRHLAKKGAQSIMVSNRSFYHAVDLANEFSGRAVRFEDCLTAMADADIVITSTACPKTLLYRRDVERLMNMRRNRPLFLIDISVPRNIEAAVQRLDNVYLYNIDDLEAIVRKSVFAREQELPVCHQIINARAVALMAKLDLKRERLYEAGLQPQPEDVSRSAAHLRTPPMVLQGRIPLLQID